MVNYTRTEAVPWHSIYLFCLSNAMKGNHRHQRDCHRDLPSHPIVYLFAYSLGKNSSWPQTSVCFSWKWLEVQIYPTDCFHNISRQHIIPLEEIECKVGCIPLFYLFIWNFHCKCALRTKITCLDGVFTPDSCWNTYMNCWNHTMV